MSEKTQPAYKKLDERAQAQLENVPYIEPGTQTVGKREVSYWVCQKCGLHEVGGLGKPTICIKCGWNKWEQEDVPVAAQPADGALPTVDEAIKMQPFKLKCPVKLPCELERGHAGECCVGPADGALRELAETWRKEQRTYPNTPEGDAAAAAVRCCANELERALAAQKEPK